MQGVCTRLGRASGALLCAAFLVAAASPDEQPGASGRAAPEPGPRHRTSVSAYEQLYEDVQSRDAPDAADHPEALRHLIVDKERIAQEAADRLRSLREAGNPHIARGLLLSTVETDPARARVDTDRLRQRWIHILERRPGPPPPLAPTDAGPEPGPTGSGDGSDSHAEEGSSQRSASPDGVSWLHTAAILATLLALGIWVRK